MLFFTLIGCFVSSSHAEYHRLYRGFKIIEPAAFIQVMNRDFFPWFQKAVLHGLVAYRPALLDESGLPNEIVLLTFKDEPTYRSYIQTEVGRKIRAAHVPVFDSSKSNSVVPVGFDGKVEEESAYLLNPELGHESESFSGMLVMHQLRTGVSIDRERVGRILSESVGQRVITLVAKDYSIEFLFASSETALKAVKNDRVVRYSNVFVSHRFIPLAKVKIGQRSLKFGEGMDAQW